MTLNSTRPIKAEYLQLHKSSLKIIIFAINTSCYVNFKNVASMCEKLL